MKITKSTSTTSTRGVMLMSACNSSLSLIRIAIVCFSLFCFRERHKLYSAQTNDRQFFSDTLHLSEQLSDTLRQPIKKPYGRKGDANTERRSDEGFSNPCGNDT